MLVSIIYSKHPLEDVAREKFQESHGLGGPEPRIT